MILDIVKYPNKVLTKKTKPVGEVDAGVKKLIDDMVETLYVKRGAGLAANQVGSNKRLAIMDIAGQLLILINPKITNKKGKAIMAEGCLSFPGLELQIKRPAKIEVSYLDKRGRPQKIKAEQTAARIICHEIDHLDGKTMLDRLPLLKRLKMKRQLRRK